jgi:hypothetical protein
MHSRNSELLLSHSLLKLEYSLLGVAIDKSLVDVEVGVKIE